MLFLVDKTCYVNGSEVNDNSEFADNDADTGNDTKNMVLNRPEVKRLVSKWKWSQPSYKGNISSQRNYSTMSLTV